jgi:DNA polymerase III sliding clamp (beta) subunit (PCNA family)
MNFSVQTKALKNALAGFSKICFKNTAPILNCVQMIANGNQLTIIGMNYDFFLTQRIPATVNASAEFAIPFNIINDIAKSAKVETLIFKQIVKDERPTLEVNTGKIVRTVYLETSEEFPVIPSFDNKKPKHRLNTNPKTLLDALDKVSFLAGKNDPRTKLNGIHFEFRDSNLNLVTTDGCALGLYPCTNQFKIDGIEKDGLYILPTSAVEKLDPIFKNIDSNSFTDSFTVEFFEGEERKEKNKYYDAELNYGNDEDYIVKDPDYVRIQSENMTSIIRLIDSEDLDYRMVFPQDFDKSYTVNMKELSEVISEMSRIAQFSVKFQLDDKFVIEAVSQELGDATAEIKVSDYVNNLTGEDAGQQLTIGVSLKYLTAVLKEGCAKQDVPLEIRVDKKGFNPIIFKQVGAANVYLVMPVRL